MLKRFSSVAALFVSILFVVSCATKKPATDPNAAGAGAESGKMDANVASQDMAFDSTGSDSGKINGLHTVHFELDSSTLSADTRKELAENADWIKANPKVTVQIEGHCDSRGSVEYNLALGERRAKAVKNYMVTLGVDSKRMTVISYGEEKPVDTGSSEEAYAKNRRANFVPLAQ
jgi:peptidoglycan-associated lipoprotein